MVSKNYTPESCNEKLIQHVNALNAERANDLAEAGACFKQASSHYESGFGVFRETPVDPGCVLE
jgi:hypothetical protein